MCIRDRNVTNSGSSADCMADFTVADAGETVAVDACSNVVCNGEKVSLHAKRANTANSNGVSCIIKYVFGDLTGHCSP